MFEAEKRCDLLQAQDWLTTAVEQDTGHGGARRRRCDGDFLTPGDFWARRSWRFLSSWPTRRSALSSMTTTEGGYFIDAATGCLRPGASGDRRATPGTGDAL
ncbi:MAG: hypothetical protein R3E51_16200 [Rhizobiaceae bacterium]